MRRILFYIRNLNFRLEKYFISFVSLPSLQELRAVYMVSHPLHFQKNPVRTFRLRDPFWLQGHPVSFTGIWTQISLFLAQCSNQYTILTLASKLEYNWYFWTKDSATHMLDWKTKACSSETTAIKTQHSTLLAYRTSHLILWIPNHVKHFHNSKGLK